MEPWEPGNSCLCVYQFRIYPIILILYSGSWDSLISTHPWIGIWIWPCIQSIQCPRRSCLFFCEMGLWIHWIITWDQTFSERGQRCFPSLIVEIWAQGFLCIILCSTNCGSERFLSFFSGKETKCHWSTKSFIHIQEHFSRHFWVCATRGQDPFQLWCRGKTMSTILWMKFKLYFIAESHHTSSVCLCVYERWFLSSVSVGARHGDSGHCNKIQPA